MLVGKTRPCFVVSPSESSEGRTRKSLRVLAHAEEVRARCVMLRVRDSYMCPRLPDSWATWTSTIPSPHHDEPVSTTELNPRILLTLCIPGIKLSTDRSLSSRIPPTRLGRTMSSCIFTQERLVPAQSKHLDASSSKNNIVPVKATVKAPMPLFLALSRYITPSNCPQYPPKSWQKFVSATSEITFPLRALFPALSTGLPLFPGPLTPVVHSPSFQAIPTLTNTF